MKKQLLIFGLATALLTGACSANRDCDLFACNRKACPTARTPAYFAFDSSVLSTEDRDNLDMIAQRLMANPDERITINGYADNQGPQAYNKELSLERAESAAKYLEWKGINPNRIKTHGYGASNFATGNATPADRAKNRRIEVLFTK